jgi:hypothetical protein
MVTDPNATMINSLTVQAMLNLPSLYGPSDLIGSGNADPPAILVSTLEQLETATADPTLLTGSETIASVETQMVTDLQSLTVAMGQEIQLLSSGEIGDEGRVSGALIQTQMYPSDVTAVEADAKLFTAGSTPSITLVDPPPPPTSGAEQYQVTDMTTGVEDWENGQVYSGPVANLKSEFVAISTDNLNITATGPNDFIRTGSGNDAINVSQDEAGGYNVLDGGTGSNFLVGGVLSNRTVDTFFVDDRGPTSSIWSTVVNFHSGDAATIWGITPSDFTLSWVDGQGASGYTGLTLHATAAGVPTASLTLAGFTSADLTNGKLAVSFGTTAATGGVPGSTYMYVHAT